MYYYILPVVYLSLIIYPFVFGKGLFDEKKGILCLDFVSKTGTNNPFFKHDHYLVNLKEFNRHEADKAYFDSKKSNAEQTNETNQITNDIERLNKELNNKNKDQNEFVKFNKHFKKMKTDSIDVMNDLLYEIEKWKDLKKYDSVHIFYYSNCFSSIIDNNINNKQFDIHTHNISSIYGSMFPNQKYINVIDKNKKAGNKCQQLLSTVLLQYPNDKHGINQIM